MVSYTYDNADRVTSITQGTSVVTYAYDSAGRRTTLSLPNGVTTEYAYDVADRMTGLTYKNGPTTLGVLTYGYDGNGGRIHIAGTWARTGLPPTLASATYDAANRHLTFGSQALTYDVNGHLTGDGTTTYTWDARNRLAGVDTTGLTASFQYDALGRRIGKTFNGTATSVLHDGLNAAQEVTGGTVRSILTGLRIDEYLSHASTSGEARFALADVLGSTIALMDGAGTVVTEYTYEPFGATATSGGASENRAQYTGRENDGTGLYYYRARYYSPGLQRFISEDPIGFLGGLNVYSYAYNSPVSLTDPLGLYTGSVCIKVSVRSLLGLGGGTCFNGGWDRKRGFSFSITGTAGGGGTAGLGAALLISVGGSNAPSVHELTGGSVSTSRPWKNAGERVAPPVFE
jgi:RHS repeat-associated protein